MIDNIYKPNIILEEVFPSEAEEKRNNKCKNMLNHFFFNPQWRYPQKKRTDVLLEYSRREDVKKKLLQPSPQMFLTPSLRSFLFQKLIF